VDHLALRQEQIDRHCDEATKILRAQVLAAAIAPVLRDLERTIRVRNGLLGAIGSQHSDDPPPAFSPAAPRASRIGPRTPT
jgi:hypothetical protein